MHQTVVPDPLLILVNNPKQPLHGRNSFKSPLKKDDQKPLKKSTLFFLPKPVLYNEQSYQKKRDLELVLSCSSGFQKSSFISYILSDQV